MPSGSSVRSLESRRLKPTKKWNRTNIQSWLNLIPHSPPPLERSFRRATRKLHNHFFFQKEKIFLQAVKRRTKFSAKIGSRRCQAAVLSDRYRQGVWNQQEMKSIKYSGLTQPHAPLPTTTRALISTPHTRKSHSYFFLRKKKRAKSVHRAETLFLLHFSGLKVKKGENIRLEEGGKQKTCPQAVKGRTRFAAKPGSRGSRAAVLSGHY